MGNVIINEKYLKDIAAALRVKHDTNKKYKTSEMAGAIQSITQLVNNGIDVDTLIENQTFTGVIKAPETTTLTAIFKKSKITNYIGPKTNMVYANAFQECADLLTFESNQETIVLGPGAFNSCKNLSSIGSNWYQIENKAFYHCDLLKRIRVEKIADKTDLGVVIGTYSENFQYCYNLEKIDIRGPVYEFNCSTQTGGTCSKLKAIILRDTSRLTKITNTFIALPTNCYIYVPASMYNSYLQYAQNLNATSNQDPGLLDRFRVIEDYPDICEWKED